MTCKPCQAAASAAQMAKSGAKAAYQIASGEVQKVDDKTQAERLEHCRTCPELKRFQDWLPAGADVGTSDRCGACGCFVRLKTQYDGFSCPKGNW